SVISKLKDTHAIPICQLNSRYPRTEIEYPTCIHERQWHIAICVEYFRVCVQEFVD
ncbi:hypothetical protein V1477_007565, partial [Vespula maculifrons]